MFYIKRRIIAVDLYNIVSEPTIKKLSNKKIVCTFQAFIQITDKRSFKNMRSSFNFYLVDITTAPYSLFFWRAIYDTQEKGIIHHGYIKPYGYLYKPNKETLAFYIADALERRKGEDYQEPKGDDAPAIMLFNQHFSYFEGEEYLKRKYPSLNKPEEELEKDYIKDLLYKLSTPKRVYYPTSLDKTIREIMFRDLSPIINPSHKQELEGKSVYYKLLSTQADNLSKNSNIDKPLAIRIILSHRNYKKMIEKEAQ